MSDGTTATTATETTAVETTVTPPVVATPPTPLATHTASTTNNRADYVQLPDDHPIVKAYNATKEELKTFKDAATKAEQDKMLREQRFEELLPQKIEQAVYPVKTELEKAQKELDKKAKAYADLQAQYTGLEASVKSSKVQTAVKDAYLASGPIKEGMNEAFDVIYSTHRDKFVLDGDAVKVGDKDLTTFFGELKTAPVFSGLFASEQKPSGTGTPPNKAVAGANGSGKASINAADMTRRNWGGPDALQKIISGELTVNASVTGE